MFQHVSTGWTLIAMRLLPLCALYSTTWPSLFINLLRSLPKHIRGVHEDTCHPFHYSGIYRNIFNSKRHIFSHTNIWSHWTISLKSKINTPIILNQNSASISLGTRGLPPCQQHPVGEEISKASRHPLELEVKISNGTENFSYPGQVIPDADKAARLILFVVEEWCMVWISSLNIFDRPKSNIVLKINVEHVFNNIFQQKK